MSDRSSGRKIDKTVASNHSMRTCLLRATVTLPKQWASALDSPRQMFRYCPYQPNSKSCIQAWMRIDSDRRQSHVLHISVKPDPDALYSMHEAWKVQSIRSRTSKASTRLS